METLKGNYALYTAKLNTVFFWLHFFIMKHWEHLPILFLGSRAL